MRPLLASPPTRMDPTEPNQPDRRTGISLGDQVDRCLGGPDALLELGSAEAVLLPPGRRLFGWCVSRAAVAGRDTHDHGLSVLCILVGCFSASSGERLTGVRGRLGLPRSQDAREGYAFQRVRLAGMACCRRGLAA